MPLFGLHLPDHNPEPLQLSVRLPHSHAHRPLRGRVPLPRLRHRVPHGHDALPNKNHDDVNQAADDNNEEEHHLHHPPDNVRLLDADARDHEHRHAAAQVQLDDEVVVDAVPQGYAHDQTGRLPHDAMPCADMPRDDDDECAVRVRAQDGAVRDRVCYGVSYGLSDADFNV
ncbi:hypothetical protein N657DRAFT_643914 [Parathielavia appendiculata]|uniref:Uncharacterized protein n=1 Tax=Parathielavia appendiculata TaxID=2587402 RepID=A0AAN6U296_9PEZI|nr:hypothetical protein N657DRAFT_643914 [Parathielavia appendiculata]